LRSNVTPAGGVEVVLQNQDILGVRAAPPEQVDRSPGSPRRLGQHRTVTLSRPPAAHPGRPGVQGLAQGLFERAQAAGLDKTFYSTVADIRVRHTSRTNLTARKICQKDIHPISQTCPSLRLATLLAIILNSHPSHRLAALYQQDPDSSRPCTILLLHFRPHSDQPLQPAHLLTVTSRSKLYVMPSGTWPNCAWP
jgi:hypothetical protein